MGDNRELGRSSMGEGTDRDQDGSSQAEWITEVPSNPYYSVIL